MRLAKGLEFRAVAVMACYDEIIPSQERIEVADDADLEVVHDTERHLLYVGCTRARDHLLVTGVLMLPTPLLCPFKLKASIERAKETIVFAIVI
jgi:superfamily I DNA/RNA helicase